MPDRINRKPSKFKSIDFKKLNLSKAFTPHKPQLGRRILVFSYPPVKRKDAFFFRFHDLVGNFCRMTICRQDISRSLAQLVITQEIIYNQDLEMNEK